MSKTIDIGNQCFSQFILLMKLIYLQNVFMYLGITPIHNEKQSMFDFYSSNLTNQVSIYLLLNKDYNVPI